MDQLKKVPLVIYGPEGDRQVVGEAEIDAVYPRAEVNMVIHDSEIWEKLTAGQRDLLSIGYSPAGDYHPMVWETFMRRPFPVEAVEVTKENFDVIAGMTGERGEKQDGTPFIQTDRSVVPNVFRIYLGFWLTKLDGNLRAYSAKTFSEMFEAP